jgi:ribose 5-phosphate isomerase B
MKVFIASDHAGFKLKQYLIEKSSFALLDLGTNSNESCDYPIFANKLLDNVLKSDLDNTLKHEDNYENNYGVLICSTGIGMTIAANRRIGIRAALCFNEKMAELSRRHNNSNVIVFGESIINAETALNCLSIFLKTNFEKEERHIRRLKLIDGE